METGRSRRPGGCRLLVNAPNTCEHSVQGTDERQALQAAVEAGERVGVGVLETTATP